MLLQWLSLCNFQEKCLIKKQPEAYTYEVIGGNNSRAALVEIQKKHPELTSNPNFRVRPVSIYSTLTDEEAQYLAIKHNRATHFTHSMTTQEKVNFFNKCMYSCMCVLTYMFWSIFTDCPVSKEAVQHEFKYSCYSWKCSTRIYRVEISLCDMSTVSCFEWQKLSTMLLWLLY